MSNITKCTRPSETTVKEWEECKRCWVANCGYSFLKESNPHWGEQKGICQWEHCIENQPIRMERDEFSCPVFGHDCPGGKEQVKECKEEYDKMMASLDGN